MGCLLTTAYGFYLPCGKKRSVLLLVHIILFLLVIGGGSGCRDTDRSALEGLEKGLNSRRVDGWDLNSSCCNWEGVTCESFPSSRVQRVVGLDLSGKSLKGFLPESISGLDHLKRLDLSNNSLSGKVPSSLFEKLEKLEFLDLSFNNFSGELPRNINTRFLHAFNLSVNSFSGHLPSFSLSLSLTHLNISFNRFSGPVNASAMCNSLSRLRTISLSGNSFSGEVSSGFGVCPDLAKLELAQNSFAGQLPEDLYQLKWLRVLNVQKNNLSGKLSPGIGHLSNLMFLDLSSNRFIGTIPDVFGEMKKLKTLGLSSNMFEGTLPASFSSLHSIRVLGARSNCLSGSINLNFSAMPWLTSLDLGGNKLDGRIPASISSCTELKSLNLARNRLEGEIPKSFSNLSALEFLSLSNNSLSNLSASLGTLQHCSNLSSLILTLNHFGEALPPDGINGFKALELLVIANCHLVGTIPTWLSQCSQLKLVDLSWNRLEGNIPSWFGELPRLFYLDLSNNSFTGHIPVSFTGLKSLVSIPHNASDDDLSINSPLYSKRNSSAMGLQYNQVRSFPSSLILSNNKLSGPIWPEFGNLKQLLVFDLHMNKLSGEIPDEISGMISLEALDLSNNNLTGIIPPSLKNLTFLSKFSVAYNNLHGQIPSGKQFYTFLKSSFVGNPGLCGEPLPSCSKRGEPQAPPAQDGSKGVSRKVKAVVAGLAAGTAVVLAVICLLTSRLHPQIVEDTEKVAAISDEEDVGGSGIVIVFQDKGSSQISIQNIQEATNNFDQENIIGCGGFGLVYKATLPDGRKVAIKRLSGDFVQMEREFRAEIEALSSAMHKNLVPLQGYCKIQNTRLLIYSYMENGSLDYWLHEKPDGKSTLAWPKRLNIAHGTARGLAYLHLRCQPNILHRDIKSSNILLDEKFEAHLADFGLARLIQPYDTHITTDLVGTLGYIPPEYGQSSIATFKGDIYSLGVVFLELLTGRRPMDIAGTNESRNLVPWVFQLKKIGRENQAFDPSICNEKYNEQILYMFQITCQCLSEKPGDRPNIQQIVEQLDHVPPVT